MAIIAHRLELAADFGLPTEKKLIAWSVILGSVLMGLQV